MKADASIAQETHGMPERDRSGLVWNETRKRSVRAVPQEARSNEMAFPSTEHASRGMHLYA